MLNIVYVPRVDRKYIEGRQLYETTNRGLGIGGGLLAPRASPLNPHLYKIYIRYIYIIRFT